MTALDAPARPPVPTGRQRAAMTGLAAAVIIAVYVDVGRHRRGIGLDEPLINRWHLLIYVAMLAATVVVGYWAVRAGALERGGWRRVPLSLTVFLLGIVVMSAASAGDLLWHARFGVEVGLSALLSPSHIIGISGGSFLAAGVLLAEADSERVRLGLSGILAAWLFLAGPCLILGFVLPTARLPAVVGGHGQQLPVVIVNQMTGALIYTALIIGLFTLLLVRFELPPGGLVLILVLNIAMTGLLIGDDNALAKALQLLTLPALAIEAVTLLVRPRRATIRLRAWGLLAPFAQYVAYIGMAYALFDPWWPVHLIWSLPVATAVIGLAVTVIGVPPASFRATTGSSLTAG